MRMPVLACFALLAAAGSVMAQSPTTNPAVSFESRYDGTVNARVDRKARKVRVTYRTWSIGPGVKLDALPMKIDGDVLYELHSGRLVTHLAGQDIEREPGSFWTVRRGENQVLETFDDTVVLRTVMIR